MTPRISAEAYYAVSERVLQAMFWQGVLVPPGLAHRFTAEIVALVENDRARPSPVRCPADGDAA